MSDEIDIEEHDVFDNPMIKDIFPDISVIKKEIFDYYDNVQGIKQEPVTVTDEKSAISPIHIKLEEASSASQNSAQDYDKNKTSLKSSGNKSENVEKCSKSTKTVLNSAPNPDIDSPNFSLREHGTSLGENQRKLTNKLCEIVTKTVEKPEFKKYFQQSSCNNSLDIHFESPKIILGSKPVRKSAELENFNSNKNKSLESLVRIPEILLQDIGQSIYGSKRYCVECKILFPSESSFFDHKHNLHSWKTINISNGISDKGRKKETMTRGMNLTGQKKDLEKNKCVICRSTFHNRGNLRRHYKNIHGKNISFKPIQNRNNLTRTSVRNSLKKNTYKENESRECFHCNDKFPDQESLIEHLYNILKSKNKERRFEIKKQLKSKYGNKSQNSEYNAMNTEKNNSKEDLRQNEIFLSEVQTKANNVEKVFIKSNQKRKCVNTDKNRFNMEKNSDNNTSSAIFSTNTFNKRKYNNEFSSREKLERALSLTDSESIPLVKKLKLNVVSTKANVMSKEQDSNITISQPSNTSKIGVTKKQPHKKSIKKNQDIYECTYCAYAFLTRKAYSTHALVKHKVKKAPKATKIKFKKQCKYCSSKTISVAARNQHIYSYHPDLYYKNCSTKHEVIGKNNDEQTLQKTEFNKLKNFVLKSVNYKCGKCDIHFLSSCVAKNHEKHMELLINWKCLLCKKIFKECDKNLHLRQHKFSENINVCEFSETELSRLLYNCTKCGIHFTEERYLKHFLICGTQTTDSIYCAKCDILIEKIVFDHHEIHHKIGKSTEDFIIMTEDIIIEDNLPEEKRVVISKRKTLHEQINSLTFCDSCKCFVSDVAIGRKAHFERKCSQSIRYTCKFCGLVFTNKSINTHRQQHEKQKNLKLQDFKFFNCQGIQISPPIPEYPYCTNCEIHFVYKYTVKTHICSETEYLICKKCNIKLSESAFKLHMNFHNYVMPGNNNQSKKSRIEDSKCNSKRKTLTRNQIAEVDPLINQSRDITTECVGVLQVRQNQKHSSSPTLDEPYNRQQVEDLDLSSDMLPSNKLLSDDIRTSNVENIIRQQAVRDVEPVKTQISNNNENIDEKKQTNKRGHGHKACVIFYICVSCKVVLDEYDCVVLHCQNHYNPTPNPSLILNVCSICSRQTDVKTYENHLKQHKLCDIHDVRYITFDPTYFTADNDIWIKHVFASVSPQIYKEILSKSVYPHECRVKMDIVQKGPSNLTVYKCFKCSNFIDPDRLITHLTVKCHKKIGKFPCSVCGLPLHSREFRISHEKIHKRHGSIRLKSYNIALVNCVTHETYNNALLNAIDNYILYQCRVCDGIVDKLKRHEHQCNLDDLHECTFCGLLLYTEDFTRHLSKHKELPKYRTQNIKIILFGNSNKNNLSKKMTSTFDGTVRDYKLYMCDRCKVCENDKRTIARHTCVIDDSKWKCPKCTFYISQNSIKNHVKLHDQDTDFNKENFELIHFHNDLQNENLSSKDKGEENKDCPSEGKIISLDCKSNGNNKDDKTTDIIFKCPCDLHFVNKITAEKHVSHCPMKTKYSRQNCSKCGLCFTPQELYMHILSHHSDNKTFQCEVIEIQPGNKI